MVSLLTHICVTRPQWVKHSIFGVNHRSDPSQKSHNASGKYPSMHHFVTELCTFVHISVTKWCIVWYGAGALWDSSNRFIVTPFFPWRRHQMKTSSTLLAICVGNSPGTGECPTQRPVTQNFDVFCDLCLNKWLSKQWWGWWFGTPSLSLWCHCNAKKHTSYTTKFITSHLQSKNLKTLTHCSLMMPYGNIDLGQQWLK